MVPFLKQTARYAVEHFGDDLGSLCIVLPNRRGGLFLRKYLAEEAGRVTWAPEIFSVEDFISEISGLQEVDNLDLLFELFGVHCEIEEKKAQSFEEFLRWGPQILADFNEIDRYMADARELFATLTEARAISLWNLDNQPLTDFEAKYLAFYQSLFEYYTRLTGRLLAKQQAYQGLSFRYAADRIEASLKKLPWRHILFAGFNALTRAEEKIIETLRTGGMATLLWDADHYYLDNRQQEAGDFLRDWFRRLPEKDHQWISDDFATGEKRIEIIGSPDPVGQVKYCGNLLKSLALQGLANEKTAVVLPDEGLLIPLLNAVPDEIESLNITAGLPLKQTPLAGLAETIFQLHLHTAQFTYLASKGIRKYYYRDILKVLQHPYVRRMATRLMHGNRFVFEDTIEAIRTGHRIFIGFDDLSSGKTGLFAPGLLFLAGIFAPWETPADAVSCFKGIIENLKESFSTYPSAGKSFESDPASSMPGKLEIEYLFAFSGIIFQLGNLLETFSFDLKLPAFYQLYQQVITPTSLPFYGEPLRGVQLMGMLETRTLDFENLIILSCNEDMLPSGKINTSFIPFDLKRSFGLPTYRHKDAVYAYHFYRLIQRAKQVWILFNTEPDQLGGGDRSRYLRQIASELPVYNPKIVITERVLATPPGKREPVAAIRIPKTGQTAEALEAKAAKGFSATALNLYRNCPLKFYFSEIAGIKEPDDLEDTIDPAILGSAVHEALFSLFKPCLNCVITADFIHEMEKRSDDAVDLAFEKKFKGSDTAYGKNLLFVNVAKLMVRRFLKAEAEQFRDPEQPGKPVSIAFLEQYLDTIVQVPFGDKILDVKIKGFLDRVDQSDRGWKIIDYKTGVTEPKQVKVRDWGELAGNPDLNIAFQLLLYGYLLNRRFKDAITCSAGIISLKKIKTGFMAVAVPAPEPGKFSTILDRGTLALFEKVMEHILGEIYDAEIPFDQTDNPDLCERCPYINLCCR